MLTYNGKYVTIFYNNKYVCEGVIKSTKYNNGNDSMLLISLDNEYYFNIYHPSINVVYESRVIDDTINITEIPHIMWNQVNKNKIYPLYKEVQIDKECISLVNALNNIKNIHTVGCCCGHDIGKYWVNFLISDLHVLKQLVELVSFNGPFKEDWKISSSKYASVVNDDKVVPLSLICNHIGTKAYECALKLADYLEQIGE